MPAQLCLTLCDLMDSVGRQAPLSMGFSGQEYWSEKKKRNTWVDCHFLLYKMVLNLRLLHWQTDSLPAGPLGKPQGAYPGVFR